MEETDQRAMVVGGSLSGLMAAIALARENVRVTVLEKVSADRRSGAGLQVDGPGFGASGTERLLRNLASGGKRSIQLWSSIETRLRTEALSYPNVTVQYGQRVTAVGEDGAAAWAETGNGRLEADMLVGADGHRSLVRQYVNPEKPETEFAGYLVWIASTDESALPVHVRPPADAPEVTMLDSAGGFLFGSVIQPHEASEGRRVGCTWYDNSRNDLLRRTGCLDGNVVVHSLAGSDIPEETIDGLARQVRSGWQDPWKTAMLHALEHRNITGTPIKEYVPERLVRGRIALIGDAVHVPAPITASGFNASLQDAVTLGKFASKGIAGKKACKVLEQYEAARLVKVRKIVQSGQSYNRSFGLGR